jgi:hypothetical protein
VSEFSQKPFEEVLRLLMAHKREGKSEAACALEIQRRMAAERQRREAAEAAAWQDGGFCAQCGADRVRTSTDYIDTPLLHTLSYCAACGTFWVWDHAQEAVQP